MKKLNIIFVSIFLSSCTGDFKDVVDFMNIENPNLSESSVVGQPNSASIWLSGLERQLAIVFNETLILSELGSDNYVNTQTFFNQFMDELDMQITDPDMRDTQRQIQRLRELAIFGINEVGPGDPNYNAATEAEYNYFEGLSYLYSAMYFSALPKEALGVPVTSEQHYLNAIISFDIAIGLNPKAEYHLVKARAAYYLGNKSLATTSAAAALAIDSDFDRTVGFDASNGPSNTFESALFQRATFDDLQPLPTLDFLDPKYSFLSPDRDAPVHYLKAEEALLILAEASLSDNNLNGAKNNLTTLLNLISERQVRQIDDSTEGRTQVVANSRPNKNTVTVNGRSGLVLNRNSGKVNIPSVSGTSLTASDVSSMQDNDAGLVLLYRTRQEVFIAEGIRFVDMGVKLVIDENEILLNENIKEGDLGTFGFVPTFIASIVNDLDAITYDAAGAGVATTKIDLNQILVTNKSSNLVVPFE
jgi:tetratricopeptide (TPR) repeat protein